MAPLRFNSTNEIISASLASLPLHNTKNANQPFLLTLADSDSVALSPTHMHAGNPLYATLYPSRTGISTHTIEAHT